jgi:hypothetical protein
MLSVEKTSTSSTPQDISQPSTKGGGLPSIRLSGWVSGILPKRNSEMCIELSAWGCPTIQWGGEPRSVNRNRGLRN